MTTPLAHRQSTWLPPHFQFNLHRAASFADHHLQTDMPDNPDTESNYLPINPRVHVSPTQLAWLPFDIPSDGDVDFISGLKSIAGSGDPTLREGLAVHTFLANKSMDRRAAVNSDGDFLIVPQQGALDIQTEFGMLFVQPGEICIIQRGQRFKVNLPDGPSRGYILGEWKRLSLALGCETLALLIICRNLGLQFRTSRARSPRREWSRQRPGLPASDRKVRDRASPLGNHLQARRQVLQIDAAALTVRRRSLARQLCALQIRPDQIRQCWIHFRGSHRPLDLLCSHSPIPGSDCAARRLSDLQPEMGRCESYRKPPDSATSSRSLSSPCEWLANRSLQYRPPYYHRNAASELMGLIYGEYAGRSDEFQPGGISFECGFVPHGVAYEEFKAASENQPPEMQISKGAVAFMMESSRPFTITDWAWTSEKKHEHEPKMW